MVNDKGFAMNVVCIIEARMGSTRLPEKTMKDVCGKPALLRVIERISSAKSVNAICVATSVNRDDNIIEKKCRDWNTPVFRGSEDDVLGRVLKASKFMKATVIVRAGADNVFVDPFVIDELVEIYKSGNYDLVANNLKLTFPVGIFGHVLSKELLEEIEPKAQSEQERDDVDRYVWERPKKYQLFNLEATSDQWMPELRITLDHPEDLKLVRILYREIALNNPGFTTAALVAHVKKKPNLLKINSRHVQKSAPWLK